VQLLDKAHSYFTNGNYEKALFIYSQLCHEFSQNKEYSIYPVLCDIGLENDDKAQSLFDYFTISKNDDLAQALINVKDIIKAYDGDIDQISRIMHDMSIQAQESLDAIKYEDLNFNHLTILGDNPAGHDESRVINSGECIKTFTGSKMPQGADTLLQIENVTYKDGKIFINEKVPFGSSVRPVGEGYKAGDILIKKGTKIGFAQIGVMAGLNKVMVKVAMRPDIELGDYTSLVPEFDKPEISDADVDARVKEVAQSQAPLVDIKRNRKMKEGDTAVIDFEGFVDGKAFDGGTAKDHQLLLGSGQFIPGFEDQLIGVKRDEEVEVKVTFPAEYQSKDLAGKDAVFKVKVNGIKVKEEVEINDELAKKLLAGEDDASVDKLKELVKTQIENEKLSKLYNDELKPKLLETLVSSIEFDLPEFVVEQEIDMALNKKATSMSEDEIKELREDEQKLKELRETFREEAQKSVKATFIIDSLAQAQNVKVEEQEVMQTIYYEAMQMGQDPMKAYEHYKDAGYIPAIQMSMVEDKVLSGLLNQKIQKA
jgi:trigger factor